MARVNSNGELSGRHLAPAVVLSLFLHACIFLIAARMHRVPMDAPRSHGGLSVTIESVVGHQPGVGGTPPAAVDEPLEPDNQNGGGVVEFAETDSDADAGVEITMAADRESTEMSKPEPDKTDPSTDDDLPDSPQIPDKATKAQSGGEPNLSDRRVESRVGSEPAQSAAIERPLPDVPLVDGTDVDAARAEIYRKLEDTIVYPMSARRRGIEGTVTVRVRVDSDGTLGHHEVTASSGHSVLDSAALDALKRAFPIARSAANPILTTVRIVFSLR